MSKFKGYCYQHDGTLLPPVDLEDEEEAARYLKFQGNIFPRVIIVDKRDMLVGEVRDGKLIRE